MTAPHFHNADPGLLDQVIGVSPDVEKHDTYLDIEPITGVALSAHKRIQVQISFIILEIFAVYNKIFTKVFAIFFFHKQKLDISCLPYSQCYITVHF